MIPKVYVPDKLAPLFDHQTVLENVQTYKRHDVTIWFYYSTNSVKATYVSSFLGYVVTKVVDRETWGVWEP